MRQLIAFMCAMVMAMLSTAALAQETYKIGLSGALTGRFAGTYAPVIDAVRIYIDNLNAAGGINNRKVELIVLDDGGEPSRGATNSRRLLGQEEVLLMLNTSSSATFKSMQADTERAGVPLLFAGSVCPKDVYPPAKPLQYCSTAFAAEYDSRASLDFIEKKSGKNVSLGLVAMAIPISRGEIEGAAKLADARGMRPLEPTIVPPPTADYTPFATPIRQANADWVYSWAPWVTQVRTFEALKRLGWQGRYVTWAHGEAEGELQRLKDGNFYAIGANSLFAENLPIHREIRNLVSKAGSDYPPEQMTEGWIAAMVVEAALRSAGWPATPAKVNAAMQNMNLDTRGLRGGPIRWTADNHFRATQYYRVYRWEGGRIAIDRDWWSYDVR